MRFLLLLAAVVLGTACDSNEANIALQRMMTQPKYLPYQANNHFPDGRAMRMPPEGTVPRERFVGNLSVQTGYTAVVPQGQSSVFAHLTTIPIKLTPELFKAGQKKFNIHCATCHGVTGTGDSMPGANMALVPPPTIHNEKNRNRTVGSLFQIITEGYGVMPSYAAEISVEERWAVVAYVRALQMSQNVPLAEVPPDVRQQLTRESP